MGIIIGDIYHTLLLVSSWFLGNTESFASELLDNCEEMFSQYHMHSDILNNIQPHYSTYP